MVTSQGTHRMNVLFLRAMLLLSLLLAACAGSSSASGHAPSPVPATATATIAPPSTLEVDAGWKIVYQASKDATSLKAGESQTLAFNQIPPNKSVIVYGTCTGNGSVKITVDGKSADGSSAFTGILTVTCTPSGTSSSADINSSGNGSANSVTNGDAGGIRNTADVAEQITISVIITGPVKWELMVEEPA